MEPLNLAIFGCGDFLRWQSDAIQNSQHVRVKALYDPQKGRAESFAEKLGGGAVDSPDAIFEDASVDVVLLFVPPWVRRGLFERTVASGKHALLTKPLASSAQECDEIVALAEKTSARYGVLYGRSGDGRPLALKALFESGEIGKLALYKQDWLHHYPEWNTWALDPAKNGGPFMDAMIHNLNLARYLIGRPMQRACFFSKRHAHPDLTCADTETLLADFEGEASAHLFITWGADLAVYSKEGNDREHIDQMFMVSDQGWLVRYGEGGIVAKRAREERTFPIPPVPATHYDRFALSVVEESELPEDIVSLPDAAFDIKLLRSLEANPCQTISQ